MRDEVTSREGPRRAVDVAVEDRAWISWLRVVAIVAVVVLHVSAATVGDASRGRSLLDDLALVLNRGGMFAVPLFIMISGALVLDPERFPGNRAFLRKRALRLLPPIVFWLLFYWVFKVVVLGAEIPPMAAAVAAMNGRLSTGLYFFWIILGIAVVTPVLAPWVARSSRRAQLWVAAAAAAIPVLGVATSGLRGTSASVVESPWTWWIPYVGVYLAGWVLARTAPRSWRLAAWSLVAVGCAALTAYEYGASTAPAWLSWFAGGYYSLVGQVFAVAVFMAVRGMVDTEGPLRAAARVGVARRVRSLGDVTLGVFALHIAVLEVSYRLPLIGGDPVAQTITELVGRIVVVLVVSFVLALAMRHVPLVRRLV